MPELKRGVNLGKMNRTLDPRIVPSGEYLEALNVNVGRSETGAVGTIENLLGNTKVDFDFPVGSTCIGASRDNANERIYFFLTSDLADGVYEYRQLSNQVIQLVAGDFLNFSEDYPITGINFLEGLLFWTDNLNQPRKINVDRARNNATYYNSDAKISVAKPAPFKAPDVNGFDTSGTSTFLQNKLPRFSYRWKFDDGEFSVLAPFTPICFHSAVSSVTQADVNQGEIRGLINDITSVNLQVPIPANVNVTGVELLYKESANNTVYIIEDRAVSNNDADGLDNDQEFVYASQDPFRAIPGDQITRVSDAVPRLALSQEITGSRVVYGNYLFNYNLPNLSFDVSVVNDESHSQFTNYSVKSRRTYQIGVVLADQFGRQSPVILSSTGGDTIFVEPRSGANPTQKLQITFNNEFPEWAESYRVVVKQREQEYYVWFAGDDGVTREGDGINKIPIDQTQIGDIGSNQRPSSRSVYRKIGDNDMDVTDDNDLYNVSIITGGFDPDGTPLDTIGNAVIQSSAHVYEVEPVTSAIDIFFETSTGGAKQEFTAPVDIEFYNCYLVEWETDAHLELNRIKAGFNEPNFDVGVRAHLVDEEFAGEERRSNGLIHSSGLFNSRTGLNQLNQFNEAEGGITLQLDPSDGSVQKLYAEDTQLIIFQEDKINRSPIDKDFIYSAEGGAIPVTSNTQYLGTVAPYPGEYGISKDPGSFAVYGENKFFTDRNRGVVMQLSQQGLVEISRAGMQDFFRDALSLADSIIGSYDEYHNQYNLTIKGTGFDGNEDTNVATATIEGHKDYLTVSYEDDVAGWVSFKSFNQEQGLTLNNRYYTFGQEGVSSGLYEHYTNSTRNEFYGQQVESSVEVVFNDAPSLVKDFKTIGYEGSTSWECEVIETDLITIGERPMLEDYYTANLQLTVNLTNAQVFGDDSQTIAQDGIATWNLIIVPDATFQWSDTVLPSFTPEVDVIFNTETGNAEATIMNMANEELVEYTLTGTAVPEEEIQDLNLTIDNQVLNATLSADEFNFFNPGTATFTLTPNAPEYYFELGDTSLNTSRISDLIQNASYEFQSADDGVFNGIINIARLPILVPDREISISGVTRRKDSFTIDINPDAINWVGTEITDQVYWRGNQFPLANTAITAEVNDNYLWLTEPTPVVVEATFDNVVYEMDEITFDIVYPSYAGGQDIEITYELPEPTLITEVTNTLVSFDAAGESQTLVLDSNTPEDITFVAGGVGFSAALDIDGDIVVTADPQPAGPQPLRAGDLTLTIVGRVDPQVIILQQDEQT